MNVPMLLEKRLVKEIINHRILIMKIWLAIFTFILMGEGLRASAQAVDWMRLGDLKLGMIGFRLNAELSLKTNDAVIREWGQGHPPTSNSDGMYLEARLEKDRLYLVQVTIDSNVEGYETRRVFPELDEKSDLFAEWFSGTLTCYPQDEKTSKVFSGRKFKFRRGILVKESKL